MGMGVMGPPLNGIGSYNASAVLPPLIKAEGTFESLPTLVAPLPPPPYLSVAQYQSVSSSGTFGIIGSDAAARLESFIAASQCSRAATVNPSTYPHAQQPQLEFQRPEGEQII